MLQVFHANAAWVRGSELLPDAAVVVEDGLVRDILPRAQSPASFASALRVTADLLLPGFINAHCHLEYSWLRGRLPRGSRVSFAEWVEAIGVEKNSVTPEMVTDGVGLGIRELLDGGTTTLVDCCHRAEAPEALGSSPLRHVILWEVLGLGPERAGSAAREMEDRLAAGPPTAGRRISTGINPHAPYSVGTELRGRVRALAGARPDIPCAWHLSETREEVDFFRTSSGALADFFLRRRIPFPCEPMPGCSPVEFLRREGLADRCDAAFHLNHPEPGEGALFAAPSAVVHCPGTHGYFGRPGFPMGQLRSEGANVCLGTDSLASGDSLSMLEMLRLASGEFPSLSGPELIHLATRNAGRSRLVAGTPGPLGIIEPGACADFVDVAAPGGLRADLRAVLENPKTRINGTYISGERVA